MRAAGAACRCRRARQAAELPVPDAALEPDLQPHRHPRSPADADPASVRQPGRRGAVQRGAGRRWRPCQGLRRRIGWRPAWRRSRDHAAHVVGDVHRRR
ncbi:hypothetical protein G6F35_016133 [Rhizopus arrhizus]|nr:hypothetical protein G6F35_016133 [Rhizopus arrhizus]